MIDLHAHVLPALDDGARTPAEALQMLEAAVRDGTRVVCATPHALGPDLDVARERAVAAHARLVREAAASGLELELRLASEVYYRTDLDALARERRLVCLGEGARRYVLIEFPPTHVPPEAEEVLFRLRLEGVTPVIAHPERNPSFWAAPERAVAMREQGALIQVTAGSLTGLFRKESKACARRLVESGAVDVLASDCHRVDRRPPGLSEAARVLARWAGHDLVERATDAVPRAILSGQPAPGAAA